MVITRAHPALTAPRLALSWAYSAATGRRVGLVLVVGDNAWMIARRNHQ